MYSYTKLGKNGRLGNQMFQYAALYGVGFLRGREIGIPVEGHDLLETFPNISATPLSAIIGDQDVAYREPAFSFNPDMWLCPDNCDFDGYFQSEQYFFHCADRIREEFRFASGVDRLATAFLEQASLGDSPICAVHFRRGDYLTKPSYHKNLDGEYYNAALEMVQSQIQGVKFIAFTDDLDWARKALPPEFLLADTSENGDMSHVIDMCIMSKCPIHIIANSSFSWWPAWLSGSKAVIAPKQWFGPDGPDEWQSIYAQGWTLV